MGTLRSATRNGKRTAKPRANAVSSDPRTAKLAIALREYKEAVEQQAATAEILRVIAESTESATPVFQAITRAGLRLMPDCRVALFLVQDDGLLHYMSHSGIADAGRTRVAKYFPARVEHGLVAGAAILDRRSVHVPDILDSKGRYAISERLARASGYRAVLCMPLMKAGRAIGVLSVARVAPGAFSKKQIAIAKTFADQGLIAIQNARLFSETKAALDKQTATAEILKVISSSPTNVQPVFDIIVRSAVRLAHGAHAVMLRREGDKLHLAAHYNLNVDALAQFRAAYPQPINRENPGGRAMLDRKVLNIADMEESDFAPASRKRARSGGARAVLSVPVISRGAPLAAISIGRNEPGAFDESYVSLLTTFADQAAIAIENVRLFNELRERNSALKQSLEFQGATSDILGSISSSVTDAKPVFEAIVDNVLRLFGTRYASVFLLAGDQLDLAAVKGDAVFDGRTHGTVDRFRSSFPQPVDSGTLTGKALRSGQIMQLSPIVGHREASPEAVKLAKSFGYDAMVVAPLVREGTVIGAIGTAHPEARHFSDKELAVFKAFADQAVIAIENARLFNETKEALERQTSISEVLAVISNSPTDLAPILGAVASRAAKLCDATDARIFLVDGDQIRHAAGFGDLPVRTDVFPLSRETSLGTAIMDGTVVHVRDIEEDAGKYPQSLGIARKAGWRTTLNVPLMRERNALGAISLRRREVRPFSDRQAALLKVFADQAAIAIENARLFNETKEALERQTATADILGVISRSPTDIQPVLQAVAESAARLCEATDVHIRLVQGELMPPVVQVGTIPVFYAGAETQPISRTSVPGRAILDCRTIHIHDIQHPEVREQYPDALFFKRADPGFRTILVVPLVREGTAIGSITVRRAQARPFSEQQIKLLQTFADQAVIAIENVRLFNETKEALEKQTATADILQVLSGSPADTQPVFDAIVRHAARLCESSYANVFRYDGERIHLAASEGGSAEALVALRNSYPALPNRSRVVGRVIQTAVVVHVEDTLADAEYDKAFAGTLRLRRLLGVPLRRGGRPVGAITVAWADPGPISERHEDLLKTFADQAVIAIENVRLFSETKEALERQTATAEVLSAISGSPTDVAPVHRTILQNATRLCEASFASVFLYDGEYLRAAAHLGASPAFAKHLDENRLRPSRETATRRSALEKRVVQVEDLLNDPEFAPSQAHRAENARTVLSVPMLREGALVGVITVWRREPRRFSDQQVGLLKTFADQAVIAIENVRLFNETK
ncbi:MAG: GAF domain-containing protein, partial [Steroidobacteraceae bacterium]